MPSCPLHVVIIGEDGGDEGLDGPLQKQGGGGEHFLCLVHTSYTEHIVHRIFIVHRKHIAHRTQIIHCLHNKHSILNKEHTKHK